MPQICKHPLRSVYCKVFRVLSKSLFSGGIPNTQRSQHTPVTGAKAITVIIIIIREHCMQCRILNWTCSKGNRKQDHWWKTKFESRPTVKRKISCSLLPPYFCLEYTWLFLSPLIITAHIRNPVLSS